jgi:Zn-dependent protease
MNLFDPISMIFALIVLIFSAILHEVAHGYVADRLGDPTARLLGRLTLNPIPHIDPFMSIVLPLLLLISGSPILFGGAKPVPVDPFNLKEGRKDLALVSLAGPLTNVFIAIFSALLFHLLNTVDASYIVLQIVETIARINILLAIFNLLPIPPLDGSKLFSLVLPEREAQAFLSVGELGTFILFFLLMFPIGPFSLQHLISTLYSYAINFLRF